MFRPMTLALALTGACLASGLSAETYQITLVEGGFFPIVTYVVPGDTVVFINDLETGATVQAADLSWSTGSLGVGASYALPVAAGTTLPFTYASDVAKAGALSFNPAPLDGTGAEATGGSHTQTN